MPIETQSGYKVVVSFGQRRFLLMLSQRGRRVTMNTSGFNKEAKDGLASLAKMGLIVERPLVGTNRVEFELTDLGAQVVDQMYANNAQEIADAEKDKNYQLMMHGASKWPTATCPACMEQVPVEGGKFRLHLKHDRVQKSDLNIIVPDAGIIVKSFKCPGSGAKAEANS